MTDTELIALRPGPAHALTAAFERAGTDAGDLRSELAGLVGEAGEDAPLMDRVLAALASWGGDAARDLSWRIDLMVLIDRGLVRPGDLLTGDLPGTRHAGLVLLGRTIARRVREGLPIGPFGLPSGDPAVLDAAYPGLADALGMLSRHADHPDVAGAFFRTLGSDTLTLLEVVVQTQLARAGGMGGGTTPWLDRDVRADLLLPVAAAFTTAADHDRLGSHLLDALATADGVQPRAAAGALLMELDVGALAAPEVRAAMWTIPLGYATWPAAQRVLTDAFGTVDPHTGRPLHPEPLDRLPVLHIEALQGLGDDPEAAWHALTREPGRLRLLEEFRHGDLGQSDLAGNALEAGLLVHPHEQGWTADLAAAARTHPEWGTALSQVMTEIAAIDGIPAPGSDSLARLLAPHMSDAAAIARGPSKPELMLDLGDDPDDAATVLRNYAAAIVEHDEGLIAYRDVLGSYSFASLARHARTIHEGGAPDIGARTADVRAVYRITLDSLDQANVDWERRNWLWLEVPQTFENGTELLLTSRMGPASSFAAGEVLSRAVRYPSDWLDQQLRSDAPRSQEEFEATFNSQLQKQNIVLLLASLADLPAAGQRLLVPVGLPEHMNNLRVDPAPWYMPWEEDRSYAVEVDGLAEWDADNIRAWLEENARASGLDDPADFWLYREANSMTANMHPFTTAGTGHRPNAQDWTPRYRD